VSSVSERLTIAVYHHLHSGGAKRTTDEITRRLSARHAVDLYTLSATGAAGEPIAGVRHACAWRFAPTTKLGFPFGRINYGLRLLELRRLDRLQQELARTIDAGHYDVVYVHPCQVMQTPSLLSYLQTPSVYHGREALREAYEPAVPRRYAERTGLKRLLDRLDPVAGAFHRTRASLDRRAVRSASHVLTSSAFTRAEMSRIYGVDAHVCYHGVDATHFRAVHVARDGGILAVGALTPRKGLDLIVRGLALVPEAVRPPLTVVSNYQEPRERAFIETMAAEHGVRITCLQAVSDEVLIEQYSRATIVAYTPVREPFGLVPLEAMACEAPVIGIAEGGVCESVVPGKTGLLIERDPRQFADAVAHLLWNPALCRAYGTEGRRTALSRWNWDESIAALEGHLAACARQPRR
jgi:glycosyltransferase involved in cell wall biosynthesis